MLGTDGDVLARYTVRRDEYARQHRSRLPPHPGSPAGRSTITGRAADLRSVRDRGSPRRSGVGIVEGWRGTIVHRIELDRHGQISRAKIVDPSWFNWPALPVALADTIVPDFPLSQQELQPLLRRQRPLISVGDVRDRRRSPRPVSLLRTLSRRSVADQGWSTLTAELAAGERVVQCTVGRPTFTGPSASWATTTGSVRRS